MRIRFFGTRGSIATPGPATIRYGGNTSCVEVRSAGNTLILLDCGTGGRMLGQALMASGERPLRGHILISHTHWDHIQGIPFFAPMSVTGSEWDIYAPRGLAESVREAIAGQMQYMYFPITMEQRGATVRYHELVEGAFDIGDVRVRTQYLNHPALTLGYRLETGGVSLVYACDHEPHSRQLATATAEITGQDRRHAEFLAGADLVIHDAQYTAEEYPTKTGWGHSTVEYAISVAETAGVKKLALTHHDPLRDDDTLDNLVKRQQAELNRRSSPLTIFAAAEGQCIELAASRADEDAPMPVPGFPATAGMVSALIERSVLVGVPDPAIANDLADALRADSIRVIPASTGNDVLKLALSELPSLIIIGRDLAGIEGLDVCRAIRRGEAGEEAADIPVIIVADQEDPAGGAAAGVTEWLIPPFSPQYARTRVRAWLMRVACRWMRPPVPDDEEQRLAALRRLRILDTGSEERFDRLVRVASALFDVPTALVSLVDRDRQWIKSSCGFDARETPREISFCAHAIVKRDVMVVPDSLLDQRFADNPLVTGDPRIRFYAGAPLILDDGSCVGTLCLIDVRPRQIDEKDMHLLRDIADMVRQELCAS